MAFIPNYGKSGSAPDCKNCRSFFFSLYHQYLNHQADPYARISRKHGSGIKNAGIEIGGLRERRELWRYVHPRVWNNRPAGSSHIRQGYSIR